MPDSPLRWRAPAALGACGSGMLAFVGARTELTAVFNIPSSVFASLAVAGVGLLLLAVITWFAPYVPMPEDGEYECRPPTRVELYWVRKLAEEVIDAELLTVRSLDEWQLAQPGCHQALFLVRSRGLRKESRLVGFFTVVTVTGAAQSALEAGELRGFRMRPEHFASKERPPRARFIAAIGAKGRRAKAEVLSTLRGYLAAVHDQRLDLYCRPVTPDGLRLCHRHGFLPITRVRRPQETVYRKRMAGTP